MAGDMVWVWDLFPGRAGVFFPPPFFAAIFGGGFWTWVVKFSLSVEEGLLVRLFRSSSAIRFSKASTRSRSVRPTFAMASGAVLARAMSLRNEDA
jgi:hypothetical protein